MKTQVEKLKEKLKSCKADLQVEEGKTGTLFSWLMELESMAEQLDKIRDDNKMLQTKLKAARGINNCTL